MADCNHTPPAAAPRASQSTEDITSRLDGICMQGDNITQIAGMLELCSESIATEAMSVQKHCPEALMDHTINVTDHIGFLVDTLRRIGKEIEEAGNEVSDLLSDKATPADQKREAMQ